MISIIVQPRHHTLTESSHIVRRKMSEQQQSQHEFLLGVGHPLLDVSVNVDEKFLDKYGLKPDDAILADPEHGHLIEYSFKNFESRLKLIAGGATQNSIRTAQWVFDYYDRRQTLFLGTVGDDQYAQTLEQQAKSDNVEPLYCKIRRPTLDKNNNSRYIERIDGQVNGQPVEKSAEKDKLDGFKTGVCLAFNTNNGLYRSMVTFLGAARQLNSSHIDDYMDNYVARSSLVYCGGFLLSSSFDAVRKLGDFCHENNKKFALNLSAPYICSNFGGLITQLIPNLDLIFGNEKELREFAHYHHFKTNDLQTIAMKIFDTFPCRNKEQLIIVTQNKDAVLCFMRSARIGFKQNVPKIDKEEIVDTIGGGDAFAGGFLAYYLMNKDIDLCLKCGIYCARQIIQRTGCNFDNIKFNEHDVIALFNSK